MHSQLEWDVQPTVGKAWVATSGDEQPGAVKELERWRLLDIESVGWLTAVSGSSVVVSALHDMGLETSFAVRSPSCAKCLACTRWLRLGYLSVGSECAVSF